MTAVTMFSEQKGAPSAEEQVKDWTFDELVSEINKMKKGETRTFLLPSNHFLYKVPIAFLILVCESSKNALERQFVPKGENIELQIKVAED
jgi:hypothetical protein